MTKIIKACCILLFLSSLFSCSTYREQLNKDWAAENQLVSIEKNKFEGLYSNSMAGDKTSLWVLLTDEKPLDSDFIELKVINDNQIQAILIDKGNNKIPVQIDCQSRGRYLELRTIRGFLKPAFPLLWFYYEWEILVGLRPDNKLTLLQHVGSSLFIGFFPIFGGSSGPGLEYKYNKIQ